jgi:hypothetical protein
MFSRVSTLEGRSKPTANRGLTLLGWFVLVTAAPSSLALVVLFLVFGLTSDAQTRVLGLALLFTGLISVASAVLTSRTVMPGLVLAGWCALVLTGFWAIGAGVLFLAIQFNFDEGRSLALALGGAFYLGLGLMALIPASLLSVAYLVAHALMHLRGKRV